MTDHILASHEDGVAYLRIDRPEKKNALTLAMYEGLVEALAAAEADDAVNVILLAGAEGVFTAGNDLLDFMQNPPTGKDSAVFRFLVGLATATKPLIAAVDGPAVGIGTTLLLHADLVYASERARFHLPFVNLGLVSEGASSLLLPRLAGFAKASELLLFGEPFDAQVALQIGLVNEVIAPEGLLDRATTRAKQLATRPAGALRDTKKLIRDGQRAQVLDALEREGAVFMQRLTSPEAMAAFQAFFSKKG